MRAGDLVGSLFGSFKTKLAREVAILALRHARSDGPLGKRLHEEIAHFSTTVSVEAAALRLSPGGTGAEIYLTLRPPGETYSAQWHIPGSIVRRGENIDDVKARLESREFGARFRSFTYVAERFFQERRGWFLNKIYAVELVDAPAWSGRWWPVDGCRQTRCPTMLALLSPAPLYFTTSGSASSGSTPGTSALFRGENRIVAFYDRLKEGKRRVVQ